MRAILQHNGRVLLIKKRNYYFVPYGLPNRGIEGNFEGILHNNDHILTINGEDIKKWNTTTMVTYLENHIVYGITFNSHKTYRKYLWKQIGIEHAQSGINANRCKLYRARHNEMTSDVDYVRQQSTTGRKAVRRMKIAQTWDKQCIYGCGRVHLRSAKAGELKHCCGGGTLLQDHPLPLQPLAPDIAHLLCRDLKYMSPASASINNMLAMCSSAVINNRGGGWERDMQGHHCVKINGRIQHCFPKATNSTDPSGGLSYFMFDCPEAILQHGLKLNEAGQEGRDYGIIINEFVEVIRNALLITHPFAKALKSLGNQIQQHDPPYQALRASIRGGLEHFEVANVTSYTRNGPRVSIQLDRSNQQQLIELTSQFLEPIAYPLLFNRGEKGWGIKIHEQPNAINYLPYLRSRILMPDKLENQTFFVLPSNVDPNIFIICNRFQGMARLGQVYIVDMVSREIDMQLKWILNHQKLIMQQLQQETNDNESDNESEHDDIHDTNVEQPETIETDDEAMVCLPSSFHGGRRHLRSCAIAALVLLSELGRATGFLTITCNTDWDEIKSQLLLGQTAFDRPDIVCAVFQKRKLALLHNLRHGVYFDGEIVYIMHVIEFQKRGLPHAHIVFRLSDHPAPNAPDAELADYCDRIVTAEMPKLPNHNDKSKKANIQRAYVDLVKSKMIHHCSVAVNGCKKNADAQCKRRYSDTSREVEHTFFENGYPVYKRPHADDRRVVPHNIKILIDWNGHANLEFTTSVKCILYLFKYLFKGSTSVRLYLYLIHIFLSINTPSYHYRYALMLYTIMKMILMMKTMLMKNRMKFCTI